MSDLANQTPVISDELISHLVHSGASIRKNWSFPDTSEHWIEHSRLNIKTLLENYSEIKRLDVEFNITAPEQFRAFSDRIIQKGEAEGRSSIWINKALQLHYWNDIGDALKAFSFANILKLGSLVENSVLCLSRGAYLPAAILARSVLEAQASFRRQQTQPQQALEARIKSRFGEHKRPEAELESAILKCVFGSNHVLASAEQRQTNILTHIEKLHKEPQCTGLKEAYSYLSELVHPSYFALRVLSQIEQSDGFGSQATISYVPAAGAIECAYPVVWVLSWASQDAVRKHAEFAKVLIDVAQQQSKYHELLGLD